jgi:hypothetical protein
MSRETSRMLTAEPPPRDTPGRLFTKAGQIVGFPLYGSQSLPGCAAA